jgi:hypothetical protein
MNRRGFLGAILAAGVAPAVVKAASLMPIFVRRESGLLAAEFDWKIDLQAARVADLNAEFAEGFDNRTFTEIIQETMNARRDEMVANVSANNALLRKIQMRGNVKLWPDSMLYPKRIAA